MVLCLLYTWAFSENLVYNVKLLFWIGLGFLGGVECALHTVPVKHLWQALVFMQWSTCEGLGGGDWVRNGGRGRYKCEIPQIMRLQSYSRAQTPHSVMLCLHRHCRPEGTSHGHPEEPGRPGQSPGTHPGSCRWAWPRVPSSLWHQTAQVGQKGHRHLLHGLRAPERFRVKGQRKGKQPQSSRLGWCLHQGNQDLVPEYSHRPSSWHPLAQPRGEQKFCSAVQVLCEQDSCEGIHTSARTSTITRWILFLLQFTGWLGQRFASLCVELCSLSPWLYSGL